jgi:hypothetical protein
VYKRLSPSLDVVVALIEALFSFRCYFSTNVNGLYWFCHRQILVVINGQWVSNQANIADAKWGSGKGLPILP